MPLLPGDYTIVAPALGEESPVSVRVLSAEAARVTPRFGVPLEMALEAPGEALAVGEFFPGDLIQPPPHLSGAYVLRSDDPPYGLRAIALGAGLDNAGGREALLLREVYAQPPRCLFSPRTWEAAPGRVVVDVEAAETRLSWISERPFMPWDSVFVSASKPLAAAPELTATVDDVPVELAGFLESDVRYSANVRDWVELGGHTLHISGRVVATNGVASMIEPASIPVLDVGEARSAPLTFAAAPQELAIWGEGAVSHLPPGANAACPSGCLRIATGGAIAVRWRGPLASLRVRHRDERSGDYSTGGPLESSVFEPGSQSFETWGSAEFGDADIKVLGGSEHVFLVLHVDSYRYQTQSDPRCDLLREQSVLIESIVPVPLTQQ